MSSDAVCPTQIIEVAEGAKQKGKVRNDSTARVFINALLSSGKRPEFAVWLLEKFVSNLRKGEIKSYAMKLKGVGASEEALKICLKFFE